METKFVKLSKEEEKKLIVDAQSGNRGAIARLTNANKGLVIMFSRRYWKKDSGLLMEDLIGEGYVALIRAIQKFEIGKGFRFSTFAGTCIKNAIINVLKGEKIQVSLDEYKEEISAVRLALMHRQNKEYHSKIFQAEDAKQAPKTIEELGQAIKSWEGREKCHFLRYDREVQYILGRSYPQTPEFTKMLKAMEPNEDTHKILSKWRKEGAELDVIQDAFSEYFMFWAGQVSRGGINARTSMKKWRSLQAKASKEREKIIRLWKEWAREARETHQWKAIGCGCIAAYFRLVSDLNREAEFDKVTDERDRRVRKGFEMGPPSDYKLFHLYDSLIKHLKGKTKSPHKDIKSLITWVPIRSTKDLYNKTVKKKLQKIADWEKELSGEVKKGKTIIEQKTPGTWPWYTDTIVIPMEVWKGMALPYFGEIYKRWRLKEGGHGQKAEPYFEGISPSDIVEGKAVLFHLTEYETKIILDKILMLRDLQRVE